MNQVFNFGRWALLTGKHWNENKKKYLLGLGSIGALLVLWYLFLILTNPPHAMREDVQVITYFVGLFLIGCLFASMWFGELSDGPKGMQYLLVPASTFEKLLTALLYAVLLFFICYTIVYYVVDVIMVRVCNAVDAARGIGTPGKVQTIVNIFRPGNMNDSSVIVYLYLIYLVVQAGFLLGSVYFSKYSFVKTAIAMLAVFLFFVFFLGKVMNGIMPAGHYSESMFAYRLYEGSRDKIVRIPAYVSDTILFLLKYAFAPLFWVTAYFRLKEKEV